MVPGYRRGLLWGSAVVVVAVLAYDVLHHDYFAWPGSAQRRIEAQAEILRDIGAPARWCDPSRHPKAIEGKREVLGACLRRIAPLDEFQEVYKRQYMKRTYGAVELSLIHI